MPNSSSWTRVSSSSLTSISRVTRKNPMLDLPFPTTRFYWRSETKPKTRCIECAKPSICLLSRKTRRFSCSLTSSYSSWRRMAPPRRVMVRRHGMSLVTTLLISKYPRAISTWDQTFWSKKQRRSAFKTTKRTFLKINLKNHPLQKRHL